MMISRSIRRFSALAAVFAVSLQALWPLLSHARPKDFALLTPLCTVDGITHYLEIKTGKTTPLEQRSAQHGEHCKLCVFGDDKAVAVSSLDVSVFLLAGNTGDRTALRAKPFHELPKILSARPRAPPAVA
jgi:hypothetical protein